MSLIFRLLAAVIRANLSSPLKLKEVSAINLRVFPNDLDPYFHVNNGRYLTMMDIGRVDLMLRTGMWQVARKRGWKPLVGSVSIDFRRSLGLFDRFTLTTAVTGWDDKWFLIEQVFKKGDEVYARAAVKGLFRGREGSVPTEVFLSALRDKKPSAF